MFAASFCSGYDGSGRGDNGSGGLDIGSGGGGLRDVWDTKGNGSDCHITDGGFSEGGCSRAQPTALQRVAWASSWVRQLSDSRLDRRPCPPRQVQRRVRGRHLLPRSHPAGRRRCPAVGPALAAEWPAGSQSEFVCKSQSGPWTDGKLEQSQHEPECGRRDSWWQEKVAYFLMLQMRVLWW